MRKFALSAAMILITITGFAQKLSDNITVNGVHEFTIAPEYTAKVIMSLNNVYYDAQCPSLSELKSDYMEKLSKAGIAKEKILEDVIAYALMGYEKEGTVFEFKTDSLDEMKTFLGVRSLGVSKSDSSMKTSFTQEEMANYAKAAFENAKKKAEAFAKKIGRSIGKAIYITDSNTKKIKESLYYASMLNTREYHISVSFELL